MEVKATSWIENYAQANTELSESSWRWSRHAVELRAEAAHRRFVMGDPVVVCWLCAPSSSFSFAFFWLPWAVSFCVFLAILNSVFCVFCGYLGCVLLCFSCGYLELCSSVFSVAILAVFFCGCLSLWFRAPHLHHRPRLQRRNRLIVIDRLLQIDFRLAGDHRYRRWVHGRNARGAGTVAANPWSRHSHDRNRGRAMRFDWLARSRGSVVAIRTLTSN